VIDYLQLVRTTGRFDTREQEVAHISATLKALAKELGLPVVVLAQLNRGVDARVDHRPQLSDLRESGAIEQDADKVIFVFREERYKMTAPPEEQDKVRGLAEFILAKQRNGQCGVVKLRYFDSVARFQSLAKGAA